MLSARFDPAALIIGVPNCTGPMTSNPAGPPPTNLFTIAVDAAERFVRSRLRSHMLRMAAAMDPRKGGLYELPLEIEASIEADALAAWIRVRQVWLRRDFGVRSLRVCVVLGVIAAVENGAPFAAETWAEYPKGTVGSWVKEFVANFDEDDLLDSTCGRATLTP